MRDLNLLLLQTPLVWHEPEANRRAFAARLATIEAPTDLIVLPEMFTTGFTMDPAAPAEAENGPTVDWMRGQAAATGAVLAGSVRTRAGTALRNRLLWVAPDGSVRHYDKRHLFRMADEHLAYEPGEERVVVELAGWRVALQVCYDLRFPVWSRNRGDYDLLLYVANWPAARRLHWQTLLRARAIENLSYAVGVNRTGVDGNATAYAGDSAVITPEGGVLVDAGEAEGAFRARLEAASLAAYRERFPADRDADPFTLGGR